MAAEINYKKKYFDLRARYINDLDMAFRLGIEQGAQQEQMNQMAQQQAEQAALEQAMAAGQGQPGEGGGPPGAGGGEGGEGGPPGAGGESGQEPGQDVQNQPPGQEGAAPGGAPAAGGSELDQHIAQLESMLGSPAGSPEEQQTNIAKALGEIKSLRKAQLRAIELKKSADAIPGIVKALHKPAFKLGKVASHNLTDNAKKAVTMQQKIVTDIMKKWEQEEKNAAKDIANILSVEGLTKKE